MNFVKVLWDSAMFGDMFGLDLSVAEKVLRPVLVYAFLIIALRIFGKRELAQLNPFDLVVLLMLSNTVQNAIIGNDNTLIGGIIGAIALLATNYLVVRFVLKHRRLDEILEGKPTVLIAAGKIQLKGLTKEMLNQSELTAVAHRQGFKKLEDIESCTIEPGGTFVIEGKEPRESARQYAEITARLNRIEKLLGNLQMQKPADFSPKPSGAGE